MTELIDFESLVNSYSKEIFAYLWRMLRDAHEAEDCLQDTFLRAFRAFPRLREGSNHRAWLYKIATNVARTRLKRLATERVRIADLDPVTIASSPPVAVGVEPRDRLEAVRQAIEALPAMQRAALMLRKYQELSYAEIAEALDSSQSAARANVYQALKKLQAQFQEYNHE